MNPSLRRISSGRMSLLLIILSMVLGYNELARPVWKNRYHLIHLNIFYTLWLFPFVTAVRMKFRYFKCDLNRNRSISSKTSFRDGKRFLDFEDMRLYLYVHSSSSLNQCQKVVVWTIIWFVRWLTNGKYTLGNY